MNMQILDIVLYNHNGQVRRLSFRKGAVNIITGASGTGKSAPIHIVDYCLGASRCNVPEGVIRQQVLWYALRIQLQDSEKHIDFQALVARAAPTGNRPSPDLYIEVGQSLGIPDITQLVPNTIADALIADLSTRLGIADNEHEVPSGQTRHSIHATLRHAIKFAFQPQSIIASQDTLFYQQLEPFIPQSIKDTLPYLLGAVPEDRLARRDELKRARQELRDLERRLEEEEAIKGDLPFRARGLLAEAQQTGLIGDTMIPDDPSRLVALLQPLVNWTPAQAAGPPSDQLAGL